MKTDELLAQAQRNENESSVSVAEQELTDATQAKRVLTLLKAKLLDLNEWNRHSLLSSYAPFDADGKALDSGAILCPGVFIRIKLAASGKYDWVHVLQIYNAQDEFIITVKPTFDPTDETRDENLISHFLTDAAINNFCLLRRGATAAFYVIGLDEKQNTSETRNTLETVRNVAVNAAAYLGIQHGEWEKFCHHFLADVVEEAEASEPNESQASA